MYYIVLGVPTHYNDKYNTFMWGNKNAICYSMREDEIKIAHRLLANSEDYKDVETVFIKNVTKFQEFLEFLKIDCISAAKIIKHYSLGICISIFYNEDDMEIITEGWTFTTEKYEKVKDKNPRVENIKGIENGLFAEFKVTFYNLGEEFSGFLVKKYLEVAKDMFWLYGLKKEGYI